MDFDTKVKLTVYEMIARNAVMPDSNDVAMQLGWQPGEIESSFQRNAGKRLLVLEPGSTSKIRMAHPFSGIETTFKVTVDDKTYFANCSWDAFGVAAAFHKDAVIEAADGHTGESITLEIRDNKPVSGDCFAHFAVPAAHWWDNIIYT